MLSGTTQTGPFGRLASGERSKSGRVPEKLSFAPAQSKQARLSRRGSLDSNIDVAVACRSNSVQQEAEQTPFGRVSDREDASHTAGPSANWMNIPSMHIPGLPSSIDWLPASQSLIQKATSMSTLPDFGVLEAVKTQQAPTQPSPVKDGRPPPDPKKREDFYANVGEAIRVLRSEIPTLFQKDLTYDIYREDVVFRDPKNQFHGKKDYKTIFWSLRFHGQLFFKMLYVDVLRIWESPKNPTDAGTILKMRWSVHGIPRVPWDAEGIFDGISTFKLDSSGKIFEHEVNNVILRDPPRQGNPFLAGLNLIPLPQQQRVPCPGAWFSSMDEQSEGMKGAQ